MYLNPTTPDTSVNPLGHPGVIFITSKLTHKNLRSLQDGAGRKQLTLIGQTSLALISGFSSSLNTVITDLGIKYR